MPPNRTLFLIFILAIMADCAVAQVRKSVKSAKYSVPKVSRNKARIMCPIFEDTGYPYQGIGLKMGDPFALTYKFYPNKSWAFTADAGKAASGLYNKYYRNQYNTYLPDTLGDDRSITYLTHKAKTDWFMQVKFLYQWEANKLSEGMQFYVGLGWQWRRTTLEYSYLYENGLVVTVDSRFDKFERSRFTYGPVVITGFEYSYFTLPVSAFIEIEWFTDTLLDPGYQRFQGGVGLRYVF